MSHSTCKGPKVR